MSAMHTLVSATSNGACRNPAPDLLSTSTGCLHGPVFGCCCFGGGRCCCCCQAATAAFLLTPLESGVRKSAAATCALCWVCSTKFVICCDGMLLQCSRGATSSTLALRPATSCCCVGMLLTVLQLHDRRQSSCRTSSSKCA